MLRKCITCSLVTIWAIAGVLVWGTSAFASTASTSIAFWEPTNRAGAAGTALYLGNNTSYRMSCHMVVPTVDGWVSTSTHYLYRYNTPSFNLQGFIMRDLTFLASSTNIIAASTLTTSSGGQLVEFSFTPFYVASGTPYCIGVYTDNYNSSNYVRQIVRNYHANYNFATVCLTQFDPPRSNVYVPACRKHVHTTYDVDDDVSNVSENDCSIALSPVCETLSYVLIPSRDTNRLSNVYASSAEKTPETTCVEDVATAHSVVSPIAPPQGVYMLKYPPATYELLCKSKYMTAATGYV